LIFSNAEAELPDFRWGMRYTFYSSLEKNERKIERNEKIIRKESLRELETRGPGYTKRW
jgi:hypothetical protein